MIAPAKDMGRLPLQIGIVGYGYTSPVRESLSALAIHTCSG